MAFLRLYLKMKKQNYLEQFWVSFLFVEGIDRCPHMQEELKQ